MNVMMIAPGYPDEMPLFVRGLALEGAKVIGIGDQPEHDVPHLAARHLAAYVRVPSLQDEDDPLRVPTWEQLQHLSPEERRLVVDYFRRLSQMLPR